MMYCNGSPIGPLTLAPGVVRFKDRDGDTWDVPLLGFTVVADGYFRTADGEGWEQDTVIEPVVLEDGCNPVTLSRFLEGHEDHRDCLSPQVLVGGGSS